MRSPLHAQREALEKLWEQGLSGHSLLRSHSRLVDEYILECFQAAEVAGAAELVSLVALGGYGRQELFPFSDIDLMILYRPAIGEEVGKITDAILYPLWDSGLDVGHGVRTVGESLQHAGEDFFFRVAMLDARLIGGSQLLFFELLSGYKEKFVEGEREEFVKSMKIFRDERRTRFGSHSYLLEPNIKEGKGGMRDIQAMLWTAKVVFGLEGLTGIVNAGILLEQEQEDFTNSWEALIRIRNRLHYISRRKNDQLYFEQQEELALALEYRPSKGTLAVEVFMREMYAHMQTVAIITDLFFEHVDEVLGLAGKAEGQERDRLIEKGIELRNGFINLTAAHEDLQARPYLLMRVFLASAKLGMPVHHRARKAITANLDLINDKVRVSTRMSKAFLDILENATDVLYVLELMLETGLLVAYIPEFGRILTLAQHDLYHIYTVDRHLLQTVAELHKVAVKERLHYQTLASPQILLVAALLHDIGKGVHSDHSVVGADLVKDVGRRMGFNEEECACLSFLIRYHLFVPENALRRDLNDGGFIKRCAETIGTADRLTMLYLLSISDSRATGPSAWSDWKAALMQEMFLRIQPYLEFAHFDHKGAGIIDRQMEQGVIWLRAQVADLLRSEDGFRVNVEDLSPDYLLSFSPEAVAEHIRIHRDHYRVIRQKSLIFAKDKKDKWSLLVVSTDQPGLLAKICGVMALHNLTVLNAQIFTWSDQTVVDVIEVRSADGLKFKERDWLALNQDLDLAISHRLGLGHRLYQKLASTYGRRKELQGRRESRVIIDNETSETFTVIEVYAPDRPGQLYHITQTLTDFGINIHKAFIATEVERLIDVFYVLDMRKEKIVDQEFKKEVTQGLLYAISKNEK
ncbi:MAG: [protein-PII] uridylyltransferase [Desulfocapsaceae bacterium]|nr:[protein-PII] uridylyltransferase [Desulfosporosinus sp.]MDR3629562.1 [protein-PII] uridylyltransferase [Desulfocapsaceae bacterium]